MVGIKGGAEVDVGVSEAFVPRLIPFGRALQEKRVQLHDW